MKTSPLLIVVLLCFLAACNNGPYTVTLNERVLYNPGGDATGGLLEDPNLQGCLNQILASSEIDDPAEVSLMACPSSGVQTLAGIGNLTSLEQLDLSGNAISDLGPLANLRELRVLSLRNNDVRSISPLMDLPILRFVSLEGNNRIPCRQLDNLREKIGNSLNRPMECSG